jgi:hypothetical protein
VQVQVLFPALLRHKDLRQIDVSPFLFLVFKSDTNLTQDGTYVGFVLVAEIQDSAYHEDDVVRRSDRGLPTGLRVLCQIFQI